MLASAPIRVLALTLATSVMLVASSVGQPGPAEADAQAVTPVTFAPPPPPPTPPSASEVMRLRDGLAAAEASNWSTLAALRESASDPLVRRMLHWRLASSANAQLSFNDLAGALRELDGWPGRAGMRNRAEEAILASNLSASERIAFLRGDDGPRTADGNAALALALRAAGQRSEAGELARATWREGALTPAAEQRLQDEFGAALTAEDHAARVDALLWRGQRTAAQRLLARLSPADRAVANARIAMQTRVQRGLQEAVDAVPASRAEHPGFLYDRVQYRRRAGRPEEAMPIAARIDGRDAPAAARADIFRERRLYVPRALRAGNARLAYQLVTNHGLSSGEAFADAEWLAGWISLRFLNQPRQAGEHFAHLSENVSSPVSSSRAFFWRGEAASALNQRAEAESFYAQAARFNFTYYGQLAAARVSANATMALPTLAPTTEAERARFENRELVRALRLMSQVGAQRDFESIAFYLDDVLSNPSEHEMLAQIAREQSYARTALRTAKAGLFRNIVAPQAAYPLIELPARVRASGRPEPAFVLAIIRQESEFDPGAISSANARGLMQLIPATAQLQARREGMAFNRAQLTSDPEYNMILGAAHLADLVDNYGGSYVLAAAAYNAGPGNVRTWISDWGDPRARSVNTIDWLELIPFSETRNYVQRVMENVQVYRHRLAGAPTPLTLERDINRGEF